MHGCESWTVKKAEHQRMMLLNCGVGENSWESLGQQGDPTSPSQRKSVLGVHWKDWCWSWTPILWPPDVKNWLIWKDPDAGKDWRREEKGVDRGWDGWMASPTQWTWVWVNSRSWWWTGRPDVLQSTGVTKTRTWVGDWTTMCVHCFGGVWVGEDSWESLGLQRDPTSPS